MAKDDYFVIVYRILAYLYACLKSDVKPDVEELSPKWFDINPIYWTRILEYMLEDEYIKNVYIEKFTDGMPLVKLDKIAITPKGIAYMQDNKMMIEAKEFLKTLKESFPGV